MHQKPSSFFRTDPFPKLKKFSEKALDFKKKYIAGPC